MVDDKTRIQCRAIVEMMGAPKKHIEDTITKYVEEIEKKHKDITLVDKYIAKGKKEKGGELYHVFAELDLEVKGIANLVWFCFDYMPASIEISEPDELNYTANDFTAFMNDLLAKLHKVDMTIKHLAAENQVLGKNGVTLMKNIIIVILKNGPRTPEYIAQEAGTPVDHVQKFLDSMEKEGKVKKKGKEYELNN